MNKWNRLLEALDVMYGFKDKMKSTFRKRQHTFDERTNEYVITIEYRVRRGNDSAVGHVIWHSRLVVPDWVRSE